VSPVVVEKTRQVTFVPTIADAPPPQSGVTIVVLDAAWTPAPDDRPDVLPVRPFLSRAIEQRDVVEEALSRLDAWAEEAMLADRLIVEGVTFWFRMRETSWRWLHERLLWRYALTALLGDDRPESVAVPRAEIALLDVLRLGPAIRIVDAEAADSPAEAEPAPAEAEPASGRRPISGLVSGVLGRLLRRQRSGTARPAAVRDEQDRRGAALADRVAALSAIAGPRVIVLTTPATHQRVGSADDGERRDPHLGAVIPKLVALGLEPILIGIGLDHRDDEDWRVVERDERLLPGSLLRTRWGAASDDSRAATALAGCQAVIEAAGRVPLIVDGVDLAPGLAEALQASFAGVVTANVHQLARVGRLLAELRPAAVLLAQEGIRTPWLVAGSRADVPVFAVQHGVLYPTHPGYPPRRHRALALPSCTFVYGDYTRRVLLDGAYEASEVEVSGSPRLDLDAEVDLVGARPEAREAVRRELGVADGDRLLVVSTLNLPFIQRSHFVHMLERVLGGPLPGIHVVFKQHPGERDEGPYRQLLAGLARAGGYEPPPMSVVRDIDLYRLLRAADAHLGLHSTVLTDAVAAGTPNLIAIVEGHADILGYVVAGVASPVRNVDELRRAMADPRPAEPSARRAFLDEHFRSGNASSRIADAILRRLRPDPLEVGTAARPGGESG
jgi:hypothetical protein